MRVIVVANPKGGVGKSTIATNLAGYIASQGHRVMLGDVDRQQSARTWLGLRPETARPIAGWDVAHDHIVRPPKGTTHVVLDTPAGLHGRRFDEVMKLADQVLVPLQPSIFDIYATRAFLDQVLTHRKSSQVKVGVVGTRVREHTIAADQLKAFVAQLEVPVLGYLRDTQIYIHLAARGLTLWDVAPGRVERDLQQWAPIVQWLQL
ncbi:MAG: cobyrinic acid a,c-diamide synthase [Caldimonas sp.]|uniref:ParA family protein n=1 Tax=Caldimonas manganoxidans TaxID=196015 RepID=UPI00037B742B|nr:ParA family protein [Caldimonas manganoxidans]GIX23189.1 MAG: cobyrinic acid a,c-diamide synthase [Caldimonas sp.]